jgi:hypothetical protein
MAGLLISPFVDLITFPYRAYTYGEHENELKKRLPIHQYLKENKIPERFLKQNKFEILFSGGLTPAEQYDRMLSLLLGSNYNPEAFKGKIYQGYVIYQTDLYQGSQSSKSGHILLTEETIKNFSTPFTTN